MDKLLSVKGEDLTMENFHESCENHDITICLATTNFKKIIGFLCPLKWMNRGWTHVEDRNSMIIFFDEQKIRKCLLKQEK